MGREEAATKRHVVREERGARCGATGSEKDDRTPRKEVRDETQLQGRRYNVGGETPQRQAPSDALQWGSGGDGGEGTESGDGARAAHVEMGGWGRQRTGGGGTEPRQGTLNKKGVIYDLNPLIILTEMIVEHFFIIADCIWTLILSIHGYDAGSLSVEGSRNQNEEMPGNLRLEAGRWSFRGDIGFLIVSSRFPI
ncbi:hypothetical protein ACROYT_G003050 [Oculina patagonica]